MSPSSARTEGDALSLLGTLGANPHLIQHHRLVTEAARLLCDGLQALNLDAFDADEVIVGAALHDVGKTLHPAEMHGPGSEHERAGYALLKTHGIEESIARHAWTHAAWRESTDLEPLLVALADKLWKGKRVDALEQRVIDTLARTHSIDRWSIWVECTELFDAIAAGGESRLARSRVV